MHNELKMDKLMDNWSPEYVIDLLGEIAWPFVVLILGWRLRGRLPDLWRRFSQKSELTEISAGTSGFQAKFKAQEQSKEQIDDPKVKNSDLRDSKDIGQIEERQEFASTELSNQFQEESLKIIEELNVDKQRLIEVSIKEIAILNATLSFVEINRLIFRSQFNLLLEIESSVHGFFPEKLSAHFDEVKGMGPTAFSEWDAIKYSAYLINAGLIEFHKKRYQLTYIGRSYLQYMRQNPNRVEALTKIGISPRRVQ